MQANPSVLIHQLDAGLLHLPAYEIQHLHYMYYVTDFLYLEIRASVQYVSIKIRLVNKNMLTVLNPDVRNESQGA